MATPFSFLNYRKLANFSPAPIQNGICTLEVPKGPTYYAIALNYAVNGVACTEAQAKADIRAIRLKINGTTRWETNGKRAVDCLNKYYGMGFQNGLIFIPLARPWLRMYEAIENTAWGTKNLDTFTLEVEFNTPIVSPTLTAEAYYSLNSRDLGMIVEVHDYSHPVIGAGQQEYATLPKGNGDLIALHADHGGLVTALDLDINQSNVYNGGLAGQQALQRWFSERTPQTNYAHIEGQARNLLSEGIPLMGTSDFRIKPTVTGTGTIWYLAETLNTPLGKPIAIAS